MRKLCGDPASGWEPLAASSAAISALVRMLGQHFETVFECLLQEQLQFSIMQVRRELFEAGQLLDTGGAGCHGVAHRYSQHARLRPNKKGLTAKR